MIVIDESGDLTLKIIEYEDRTTSLGNQRSLSQGFVDQEPIIRKTQDFQVCRQVLVHSSFVFKQLLSTTFAEASQSTVTLKEDGVDTMEIWFRVMHNTITESTYDVPLSEMWNLVAAADKYDLNIHDLNEWFAKWHKKNSSTYDTHQLLYPCYRFDHALGFAQATKGLAYNNTGHITESNPTKHFELHLPSRIIQQINAAKGRLRTVLHQGLFTPNDSLLRASCACKEKTLYGYEKALYNINVWPLERVAQSPSISEILDRLDNFTYEAHKDACISCRKNYNEAVKSTKKWVKSYFDGLCLDCLMKSKTGDMNKDYWVHNELDQHERVFGCRFNHSQATWYFSFMGRKEERDHFQKMKRLRKSQTSRSYWRTNAWSSDDNE